MKKKSLSAVIVWEDSKVSRVLFLLRWRFWFSVQLLIVTGVSMRFTNTSIFENSSEYSAYDHPADESEHRFLYRLHGKYCLSDHQQRGCAVSICFDEEINTEARDIVLLSQFGDDPGQPK